MEQQPDESGDDVDNLVALLLRRASEAPEAELFSYLPDGETTGAVVLSRGDLDRRARAIAARLQARGLAGRTALLVFPPGLEFLAGFFGCVHAGVIAVPAYPPRPNRPMDRLAAIVEDARPAVVLTCSSLGREAGRWTAGLGGLGGADVLFTDGEEEAGGPGVEDLAARWVDPGVSADSLAFLQYTSGSTAAPRGVMITHGNLMANSAAIQSVFGSSPGERGVSWLPLFHDMGLIGGVIQTLYCGGAMTLLSPVSFLQRPLRWLEAIDRTGASISGAPNFAFELCIERTTPEQRAALDLSRWRVAFNGAEPIRAETLDRFAEAFAPAGFRREAFLPCYGLAEATLMVSGHRQAPGRGASILAVDGQALARGEAAGAIDPARSTRLAASGRVVDGHIVAVVDPADDRPAAEGRVGEVWVSGPSVAAGYWNRPEDSARVMGARLAGHEGRTFLRTGDLGFLRDGELYVTGRIKDLIVLRGRNVYPQDVEWAAGRAHPALRPDGTAAFAIEQGGRERLAIVAEAERRLAGASPEEVFAAIRGAVAEAVEAEVAAIRLLRPASLPRTSSGKVRRHACREAFLAGTLDPEAEWTMADSDAEEVPADEAAPRAPLLASGRDDVPAAGSPRRLEIAAWLAARIAGPLGVRPEEVDVRAPLASFGIGSLRAVRLAAELEEWLGRSLPATLVYDHPTIETLAAFLADEPATTGTPVAREPAEPLAAPGREPIAIIGIGCRFPGADGPTAYWELLRSGTDAIGEVPPGRWSEAELRGLDFSRRGGFVRDADHFDAGFFGITPREAVDIDPQQRMLLEVAWEAIEDAGQAPERLAGGAVGVFIGISTGDYALRNSMHRGGLAGHQIIGNAGCIAANRISHFFDFCGPSLAIDTACSSSLVAIQMACRSLRDGETELAIAGGVNLLLDPRVFAALAQGRFLSPDGRCRAFDASANGYVRGEGAGLVVLKPLSRAQADGDPIYAVIRGGAVNQDGRTVGLTAPNRAAQEAVLRAACRHAGIQPGQVDYVEAHGTGTPLGDPIELSALGAVLGEGRRDDRPCLIGSAKTNIGHLEAAAGVGGLIKAALAIHHRTIPASLHYTRPNPHADLAGSPLQVAAALQPWPATEGPARAGVSSFGFGGTNAHLILEEAPRAPVAAEPSPAGVDGDAEDVVIPISARDPQALEKLCRSYRELLTSSAEAIRLGDLAHSAGARRGHLDCRVALVVADRDEALGALGAFLIGEPHVSVMEGRREPGLRPGPVFVLPDRPAVSRRAVRELIRREPEFRAAFARCDLALGRALGWSPLAELDAKDGSPRLDSPAGRLGLGLAMQVALAALWRAWGIEPAAIVGVGGGAIAAESLSGRLGLDDAARIAAGGGPGEIAAAPERLAEEIARRSSAGHDVFLLLGNAPGLRELIRTSAGRTAGSPRIIDATHPTDRGLESLRRAAAWLYVTGLDPDWSRVSPPGNHVRLPTYPWRRQRFWLEPPEPRGESIAVADAPAPVPHHPQSVDLISDVRDRIAGFLGVAAGQVELDRSLLAMGLDSITAMELKQDLDRAYGTNLPFSALVEDATIRSLAARLGEGLGPRGSTADDKPSGDEPPAVERRPSHGQRMLWYAHQYARTGAAYHIGGAGSIELDIDLESFRRALRRVVARHEALRSTFPTVDEAPALRIVEMRDFEARESEWLVVEDASTIERGAIPARLAEHFREGFDLQNGPLFRFHVLRGPGTRTFLLPVFHHIIADFHSTAVFLDELGRAYLEEQAGARAEWPPPASFADFVRRQEEFAAGPEGERSWSYWSDQLGGGLPVLDLPVDRPRTAARGEGGRTIHDRLDPAFTARLVALAEANGASLYTMLLSALQVFLARHAGQDDVIIGTPSAGRTRAGDEGLVGYCVNMLPMRADLAGNPPFEELLARAKRTVAGALEHQEFPFSLMIDRLRAEIDPGRAPIFQVMYAHQRSQRLDDRGLAPFVLGVAGARLDLHGFAVDSVELDRGTALYELSVVTARDGDCLRLVWEYSTDLFHDATIERMAAGFRGLLAAIVDDPTRKVGDLPLIDPGERTRMLEWWSSGPTIPPDEPGVVERFEREAAAAPGTPALVLGEEIVPYGELNRRANLIARELVARGVGPESIVGLFLEGWTLRLAAVLGVLKAGGAYVPLDPDHPGERLAAAFADSGARLLLADRPAADRAASFGADTVVMVDRLIEEHPEGNIGNPEPRASAENLAYVVFTSGTTGRPKGVMVSRRALASLATAWERLYDLRGATRRHLQAAPFAFDVFAGDWIRALTTGGVLVACPRDVRLDPAALAHHLRRHRIDFVELVPALAEVLAEELERSGDTAGLPMRILAVGSDSVRMGLLRRLGRLMGRGARVVNSYGLTETTVDSACYTLADDPGAPRPDEAPAPIGHPIGGARAYVLDGRRNPVPPGVEGELFIGGAGVGRGYAGDPRQTALRFVPDPFGEPGARMYATGDRARWTGDGLLELLGRVDGQVKIGGVRIEPGEVEAVLARHPAIGQALVVPRDDSRGGRRLAAYLVPAGSGAIAAAELRPWLRDRLPEAMIPSWFVAIPSLPLTPNGKVDRAALPAPADSAAVDDPDLAAPRDEAEATLAGIAAELLGRRSVGIHDNFFEMGVDSILGIRLVARARQAGLILEPAQLFRTPTIAGLAASLAGQRSVPEPTTPSTSPFSLLPDWLDRDALDRHAVEGGAVEDAFPLTPVQQGMLFHTLLDPEAGHYVEQFVCGLRGELDLGALRQAWHRLIERHPMLRCSIHWTDDGRPYQVIHRGVAPLVEYHDWRGLDETARDDRLARFLAEDRRAGFDPAIPPLSRLTLVRTGEQTHELVWSFHHAALDGWCLSVLLHEALDLHESLRRGEEPRDVPRRPYRDYVAWLLGRDPADAGAEAYWRRTLAGFTSPTPLGLDGPLEPGPAGAFTTSAAREIDLGPELTAALGELSRTRRLTLGAILYGAWGLLLARLSGRPDVVFGVTVSGRPPELSGVEDMVGLFINTLPLRLAVDESAPAAGWLAGLQERLVELRRFESVALAQVQRWSDVPPGLPLFESIVTVQNLPFVDDLRERADRLGVERPRYDERTHFPLALTALPGPSLRLRVDHDARRFPPDAIARALGQLQALLRAVVEGPDRPLADLHPLVDPEGDDAVEAWGHPDGSPGWDIGVHDINRMGEEELDMLIDRLD